MTWQSLQMLPLASDLEEQQIREQLILDPLNSEKKSVFDTFMKIAVCIGCISTTNSLGIYLGTLNQCRVVCCSLIPNPDFPKCTCNKEHRPSPTAIVIA